MDLHSAREKVKYETAYCSENQPTNAHRREPCAGEKGTSMKNLLDTKQVSLEEGTG